jgi:hypothetical protein
MKKQKMVITPNQAREKPGKQDRAQFRELEKAIDTALHDGNMIVTVMGGLNPRVKEQVLNRYQEAGWQVQYTLDQKGGNYFYFQGQRRSIGFYHGQ